MKTIRIQVPSETDEKDLRQVAVPPQEIALIETSPENPQHSRLIYLDKQGHGRRGIVALSSDKLVATINEQAREKLGYDLFANIERILPQASTGIGREAVVPWGKDTRTAKRGSVADLFYGGSAQIPSNRDRPVEFEMVARPALQTRNVAVNRGMITEVVPAAKPRSTYMCDPETLQKNIVVVTAGDTQIQIPTRRPMEELRQIHALPRPWNREPATPSDPSLS
ncbi:MAG: hypothetical protein H6855_01850 [Rhodospirillales bacterium]|nr:hypothetical protein [Rhodospirillales bacterium]MCB9980485.1 hypothetical protein [Rhodospirillales bacterium]